MLFFRFPFSQTIFTTEENPAKNAVNFVSFNEKTRLHFPGNIVEIPKKEFLEKNISSEILSAELTDFQEEDQNSYQKKITEVIGFVEENNLAKLVLSRRKVLPFGEKKVRLSQTFLNLCDAYSNAFVYFFVKDDQCWMGAFSELLGKFHKKSGRFETMSLAATLPINESWTNKEIAEQKPVTDFIRTVLSKYADAVHQSATTDHISGNIKHLRTDFDAKIQAADLPKIIADLHPTPAVCGIPKGICKDAITRFEDQPRKFYAGYIEVETEESVQYFVNLRCAEFYKNAAMLYVGGGITRESTPQNEWRETELKAEVLSKNINFI